MTRPEFFPDPIFGWTFATVLIGFLAAASYTDYRYLLIPKKLTIPLFFCGFLFNLVRGGWLGSKEAPTWILTAPGGWVSPGMAMGALDGFLFALTGFLVCFALFFLLWILGGCRGGDVKLVAAAGAWFGAYYSLFLFLAASIFILLLAPVAALLRMKRLKSYSFPIALAASALLAWILWGDYQRREGSQHSVATQSANAGRLSS